MVKDAVDGRVPTSVAPAVAAEFVSGSPAAGAGCNDAGKGSSAATGEGSSAPTDGSAVIGTEPDGAMSLDYPVVAAEEQLEMRSNKMDNAREVDITERDDDQSVNSSDVNSGKKRFEEVVYESICEDNSMFDEDV